VFLYHIKEKRPLSTFVVKEKRGCITRAASLNSENYGRAGDGDLRGNKASEGRNTLIKDKLEKDHENFQRPV